MNVAHVMMDVEKQLLVQIVVVLDIIVVITVNVCQMIVNLKHAKNLVMNVELVTITALNQLLVQILVLAMRFVIVIVNVKQRLPQKFVAAHFHVVRIVFLQPMHVMMLMRLYAVIHIVNHHLHHLLHHLLHHQNVLIDVPREMKDAEIHILFRDVERVVTLILVQNGVIAEIVGIQILNMFVEMMMIV
jgi:hypothetical protein